MEKEYNFSICFKGKVSKEENIFKYIFLVVII